MELKFKSSNVNNLYIAIFCSCLIIFMFIFGIVGAKITGDSEHNILMLEIFGSLLLTIWVIYLISSFLFYKTIIVTEEKIILKRKNKCLWIINKEEISECIYKRLSIKNFYSPNASTMLFKLKSTNKFARQKVSKNSSSPIYISLSYRNAKKMIGLGYNIRIIDTITEQ